MTYIPIPNPLPVSQSTDPWTVDGTVGISEANLDAFSRVRMSSPETIFTSAFRWDLQSYLWDKTETAGGTVTHLPNEASASLDVTTASGDQAQLRTREYFRYQPGHSQLVFMTFVMDAAQTNLDQRVGQFDDNNGVFLEQTDSTIQFVRRTSTSGSPVDNTVAKASWNLDALDGGGASGITLDLTKAQILVIDYQWLGYGRIRVGFDINGAIVWAHQFTHANLITVPWATTVNLPIHADIEATGALSSAATLKLTCASVISEGGVGEEPGIPYSASNATTAVTSASGTDTPILSIRPAQTFNSINTEGIHFILEEVSAYVTSNPALIKIWYNPTLTAASFATAGTGSAMEYDVAATAFSGGIPISQFYVHTSGVGSSARGGGQTDIDSKLPICITAANVATIITITGAGIGGTAPTYATARWVETR